MAVHSDIRFILFMFGQSFWCNKLKVEIKTSAVIDDWSTWVLIWSTWVVNHKPNLQLSDCIVNLLDRFLGLLAKNWVLMFLMSSSGKRCDSVPAVAAWPKHSGSDWDLQPWIPSQCVSLTYDRLCAKATVTMTKNEWQSQFVQNCSWTWFQKLGVSLPTLCLTQNFHVFVSHSCVQNWSPPSKSAELGEWSQKIDLAPSSRTMWCEHASPSAMGLHPSFEKSPECFQNHVHMLKWMLVKDTKPLPSISPTQDCQQLVSPAKCLPMLWGQGSLHHQQCALLGRINAAGIKLVSCLFLQSMTNSISVHVNDLTWVTCNNNFNTVEWI